MKRRVLWDFPKPFFLNFAGLDAHNVTTPQEMALIARSAFEHPIISEITVLKSFTIYGKDAFGNPKVISAINRNYSLMDFTPSAVKTGYLVEAERNVVLKKNDKIIVVMHALSMKQRNDIINTLLRYLK